MHLLLILLATTALFLAFRPIVERIFASFPDKGWGLAPAFSIIGFSYIAWWLNHLPFVYLSTWLVCILLIFIFAIQFYFIGIKKTLFISKPNINQVFNVLLWLLVFVAYLYLRQHSPNIVGIEKYPDYMILNSLSTSGLVPPPNVFVSEQVVNYYYFGHYMAAILSKLSFLPVNWLFHLFTAFVLASTATGLSSLTMGVLKLGNFFDHIKEQNQNHIFIFSGYMTAAFALLLGNFHTFYHSFILGIEKFWYPDATRYIQNTIHEFPYYSILIGDMHGHILNLPNVAISLSLSFLLFNKLADTDLKSEKHLDILKANKLILGLLVISFGASYASNSWDIMSTMLVAGLSAWVALSFKNKIWGISTLRFLALLSITFVLGAIISYAPFWIQFEPPSKGLAHVPDIKSSPFTKLLVIWLVHATLPALFLFATKPSVEISNFSKKSISYIKSLCALGFLLILFLELFYFKDIYTGHIRANSMFKIGLFVWIIFSLSTVCIFSITVIGRMYKKSWQLLYLILFALLLNGGLLYSYKSTNQYIDVQKHEYGNLSGLDFILKRYPAYSRAVRWVNQNTNIDDVVVTVPASSFSEDNIINVFTARPTIMTWDAHNWLWHHTRNLDMQPRTQLSKRLKIVDSVDSRLNDLNIIFNNNDPDQTRQLLNKYNAKYVVISMFERRKYPNLNESNWVQNFELSYTGGGIKIFKISNSKKVDKL